MEEKRSEPTVIIQPPAYGQDGTQPGWKKSGNVKLLIIAVTTVVLVGVVTTGFILAFKHHTEATEKALTSKIERVVGDEIEETIESDDEAMTKLYTVWTKGGSYQVLYDYNKNIRVANFNGECIVSPLNSSEVDPLTSSEKGLPSEDKHVVLFERDNVPIRDHSFLGEKGQEMCDGKLAYWGFRTCGDNDQGITISPANSTDLNSRNKRAAGVDCYREKYHDNLCCNCCGYYLCTACQYEVATLLFGRIVICHVYFVPKCGTSHILAP